MAANPFVNSGSHVQVSTQGFEQRLCFMVVIGAVNNPGVYQKYLNTGGGQGVMVKVKG